MVDLNIKKEDTLRYAKELEMAENYIISIIQKESESKALIPRLHYLFYRKRQIASNNILKFIDLNIKETVFQIKKNNAQ